MAKKRISEVVSYPKAIQDSFISNLEGIEIFVKKVEPVVVEQDKKASQFMENVKSTIREIITNRMKQDVNKKMGEGNHIQIEEEEVGKATEGVVQVLVDYYKLPRMTVRQVELLYRSAFVLLMAFFDYLIHDVIHCYYRSYPESLSDRDKELKISLSELKLCADRDEAVNMIIDKRVDSVLYESLVSQKKFLEEELHIDVGGSVVNWDIINECVERRNVIVHNDCIANRRYLKSVELSVVPEGRRLKEGERLGVSAEYFKRSYDEILVAGVAIVQSCWRKWRKEDINTADRSLIMTAYNLLTREEWRVTEKIGYLSKGMKVYDASNRNILDINYCQSLKWQGKKAELKVELDKFDESNLSPKYKVGLAALKSDRESFYKYAKQAVEIKEIDEEALREWPLFRELREDAEYEEKIKAILCKKKSRVRKGEKRSSDLLSKGD